ncbi:MAG: STT3 domain-containing protein [Candidatus Altiarchaeota archaeon]
MGDSEGFEIKLKLPDFAEHIQEPLFLLSIIAFLIAAARLIVGMGSVAGVLYIGSFFIGCLSLYFIKMYFKGGTKNFWFFGVPVLIFVVTLFLYYSTIYAGGMGRDYTIFSVVFGVFLLAYAASMHKLMKPQMAAVLALFLSTLIIHLVPAELPFISNIDPYWYYKWADLTYTTGFLPDHDYMTYPIWGGIQKYNPNIPPGLNISVVPLFASLFIASMATLTKLIGISLYDVAMLYGGIMGALTVLLFYLLVKELFHDMPPYNNIAAILAAFMLMLSPAFAISAIASNTEDDAMGMFLFVASFYLFVMAFRRKSLILALLSGYSFLLLRMSWGGYVYAAIIIAIFSIVYSLVNFIHRRDCLEHIPYVLIALIPSFLTPFFLHPLKTLPNINSFYPGNIIAATLAGMLLVTIILENIRKHRYGKNRVEKKVFMDSIENTIRDNMAPITLLIVASVIAGSYYIGWDLIKNQMLEIVKDVRAHDVITVTIAEQNPTSNSIKEFLAYTPMRFGIAILYGLVMIPVLLYIGLTRRSFGALFILTWSLPMIYGVYNKSQYLFTASVPIAALGATIGLFSIAKKKDFESIRIIGAIFVMITPLIFIPFTGASNYDKFVGVHPLYTGLGDVYYWQPALTWMREKTPNNTAIITWWDYGHWITSTGYRSVLIDNLQADAFQIQDVARFFVNKTSEEEAFDIVRNYSSMYSNITNLYPEGVDLRYVVIDWTMIGKGSALHEIATGDIDNEIIGSFRNYAHCGFSPQESDLKPRITTKEDGTVAYTQRIVFRCVPAYISYVIFDVSENSFTVSVMDLYGRRILWDNWIQDNDASILGVQPLSTIMTCTTQWARLPENNICRFPPYNTLVYVPGEFSDFMMTKLYLGDYIEEYKQYGLYNREITPLKHFRLLDEFNGFEDYPGEQDYSSWGYVRAYEIID